jgi:hypothetical protein
MTPQGIFWKNSPKSVCRPKIRQHRSHRFMEKIIYLKWCAIVICNLYQFLVWSLEISLWCIRHFSFDPLTFLSCKIKKWFKTNMSSKIWKFCSSGAAWRDWNFFFVGKRRSWWIIYLYPRHYIRDTESHEGVTSCPSKLEIQQFFINCRVFWPLDRKINIW